MQPTAFLSNRLGKLQRHVRETGLRATGRFVVTRAWRHVLLRQELIVLVKELDEIAVPARRGVVRVEPTAARHLDGLRALNAERGDAGGDARFSADVAAGYGGFVGLADEQVVACYWWVDRAMRPPHRDMAAFGLGIELGERDVYGCDLYILEAHRAGGTVAEFLYEVERGLGERGFERIWGYVVSDNRAARWNYSARGYRPIWRVVRTRVLHRWRSRTAAIEGDTERA